MNSKTYNGWVPPANYRLDEEDPNYIKSFSVDEEEEYYQFFKECGFVVIRDIIPPEDCDATVDEIWKYISSVTSDDIQQNDPNTWNTDLWPTKKTGILGSRVVDDKMAWKNRSSPDLHRVYSKLYGTSELVISLDRYNIMRPTKNVDFGNGIIKDMPEWKGLESWFHWDLNPWYWTGISKPTQEPEMYEEHGLLFSRNLVNLITEGNNTPKRHPDSQKLQGLVALGDTPFSTGGFQCVPGFVGDTLKQWSLKNQKLEETYKDRHFVGVPKDDPLIECTQVVPLKKGSLVVWSSELPHCNRLNNSELFRYCQYIKMVPIADLHDVEGRAIVVSNSLKRGFCYQQHSNNPVFGLHLKEKKKSKSLPVISITSFISIFFISVFTYFSWNYFTRN